MSEATGCLRTRRAGCRRPHHGPRQGLRACRCRHGWRTWSWPPAGAGEAAARVAAMLTARPRRQQRRPAIAGWTVPPRPLAARIQRRKSRRAGAAVACGRGAPEWMSRRPPASCWRSHFPTVSRATAAMAVRARERRGAAVEQTSSLARAPYIAVARLTGGAARAHPAGGADHASRDRNALRRSDRNGKEISFDRGAIALRARRKQTLQAITLSEAPVALSPSAETARFLPGSDCLRARRAAVVENPEAWRDRVMFLRKAEGESWPDLSDAALAAIARLAGAFLYDKPSLKEFPPAISPTR